MDNKTLSTSAVASFIVATIVLTGCASLPKTDLAANNREKLHSIAMLDVTEPRGESVVNLGGAAGAFGLIGGLVQGGINANHTSTYTQRVASEKIAFAPVVNDSLTTRLSSNGYEIVPLHDQHAKLSSDGKANSVHVEADAKYHYGSFGTLIDQFDQSVAGLKDCEQAVVAAIGQDLTKP